MAFLPPESLELTGGCLCSAIRYKISIPESDFRPLAPGALPTPIRKGHSHLPKNSRHITQDEEIPTRFPLIEIDHCQSCRRACGGLIQCWIIVLYDWVEFHLQSRATSRDARHGDPLIDSEGHFYNTADVATGAEAVLQETYLGKYESSPNIHRTFCTRCGTGMAYCYAGPKPEAWTLGPIVDIALGTLDLESLEKDGVRPERHGWWEDGVGWIKKLVSEGDGGLIRHPTGALPKYLVGRDRPKANSEHMNESWS
ncbi:hypothetical protein FKW77_004859 [Venturia effusa]|uniref:CENP-V/GFA domain-containing protein n=1 Tax=Venturia effusa TaxID=50376 RepID=A0A517L197_9PEZI|nr:hypothetical protein FKW77_004859 [Venturia effusa]